MHKQVTECISGYWVQYRQTDRPGWKLGRSCYGNCCKCQIWKQKQNGCQSFCYFKPKCHVEQLKESSENQNTLKAKHTDRQTDRPGGKFGRGCYGNTCKCKCQIWKQKQNG